MVMCTAHVWWTFGGIIIIIETFSIVLGGGEQLT